MLKFNVSKAFDRSKNIAVGDFIFFILSISVVIESTNFTHANSVECCDLKPYCCSDKRKLALR